MRYGIILTVVIVGIGRRTNSDNVNKDHHRGNGSMPEHNVENVARLDLRANFGYVKSMMVYWWHVHTGSWNKQAGGNSHRALTN